MVSPTRKIVLAFAVAFPLAASAVPVHVDVKGSVDYNVIRGDMSVVNSGDPVVMGFDVDSDSYVDSGSYPTRGYVIDASSFSMTVGGVPVLFDDPQPVPAYFVLRDKDPAVDGFFMSGGSVDLPFPTTVHIPGLVPDHELDYLTTFNDGATLTSLNILDAVGTYGTANLSVYNWTIGRFGNPGAEYVYESITISAVPEPTTLALMAMGLLGVGVLRRARRQAS
jgi:hypothetical protein